MHARAAGVGLRQASGCLRIRVGTVVGAHLVGVGVGVGVAVIWGYNCGHRCGCGCVGEWGRQTEYAGVDAGMSKGSRGCAGVDMACGCVVCGYLACGYRVCGCRMCGYRVWIKGVCM